MYTKLFHSILTSTVWRASNETRIVWITLLALTDKRGIAEGSIPGLADAARVSIPDCERALAELSSPDSYSRTKEFEGRRIEEVPGVGWQILNHASYRSKMSVDERREYQRVKQQEYRDRKKITKNSEIDSVNSALTKFTNVGDTFTQFTHTDTDKEEEVSFSSFSSSLRSEEKEPNSPELEANSGTVGGVGALGEESDARRPPVDKGKPTAPRGDGRRADVETVFAAWQLRLNHKKAALDEDRYKPIRRALNYHSVEDLCRVPIGVMRSPFHMGQNDRGRKFDYPSVIFKNADQIESFLALADEPVSGAVSKSEAEAIVKAQEECGCADLGGMRKIVREGRTKYVRCNHMPELPASPSETPVWPPPVK